MPGSGGGRSPLREINDLPIPPLSLKANARPIVLFLCAMRHFAQELRDKGRTVHNHRLDDIGPAANLKSLGAMRQVDISLLAPQSVVMTAPDD